jgi:hypothetical protein
MTVEPFTKSSGLVIFVTVVEVRGESVVFGGGLQDPLLNFENFVTEEWYHMLNEDITPAKS